MACVCVSVARRGVLLSPARRGPKERKVTMGIGELFLVGLSLSMDAFAVSICKGLSVRRLKLSHAILCGVYFGGFQALMPTLGYFLGGTFSGLIQDVGYWLAFILLALIGANMVRESFGETESLNDDFSPKAMLPLAVATSIDALAVGVAFAAVDVSIGPAAGLIGVTTFVCSAIGVMIGAVFGAKFRALAERAGGIVLILIGLKTLLDGLGVLG